MEVWMAVVVAALARRMAHWAGTRAAVVKAMVHTAAAEAAQLAARMERMKAEVQLAAAVAVPMVTHEVMAATQEEAKATVAMEVWMAVVVAALARRMAHSAGTRAAVVKAMD